MKRTLLAIICLALLISTIACAAPQQVSPNWWGKAPVQGQKPVVSGTVAGVSATSIGIQTPEGVKTFTVGPRTRVNVAGTQGTIADIKTGMQVTVNYRVIKNVPAAMRVAVPKPAYKGKITAIDGSAITLKGKEGDLHITVTDTTKIKSQGYEGKLSDLRVGYGARAQGAVANNVMTAEVVMFEPAMARGAVTAIDGTTITVKTVKQLSLTLTATDKTAVLVRPRVGPNVKGTLADVKVGSPVNAGFAPSTDGASQLFWIDVLTGM